MKAIIENYYHKYFINHENNKINQNDLISGHVGCELHGM